MCLTLLFPDAVTDFSWEPKGERFAIISSNDPNLGNPGPGITIKTDVSFYQLHRTKGDFKLLRKFPLTLDRHWCLNAIRQQVHFLGEPATRSDGRREADMLCSPLSGRPRSLNSSFGTSTSTQTNVAKAPVSRRRSGLRLSSIWAQQTITL